MLVLIVLWWILVQLSAPVWCYVILGFAIFARCIGSLIDACKNLVDLSELGKKNTK